MPGFVKGKMSKSGLNNLIKDIILYGKILRVYDFHDERALSDFIGLRIGNDGIGYVKFRRHVSTTSHTNYEGEVEYLRIYRAYDLSLPEKSLARFPASRYKQVIIDKADLIQNTMDLDIMTTSDFEKIKKVISVMSFCKLFYEEPDVEYREKLFTLYKKSYVYFKTYLARHEPETDLIERLTKEIVGYLFNEKLTEEITGDVPEFEEISGDLNIKLQYR